jgi:hypothetical protein
MFAKFNAPAITEYTYDSEEHRNRAAQMVAGIKIETVSTQAVAIPQRTLDMSKVAEAQSWSANMFADLSSE